MFSSVNSKVKAEVYKALSDEPIKNVPLLISKLKEEIEKKNFDYVRESMKAIKFMIKDNINAEPKFYGLQVLKELMKTQNKEVVEYFIKKLMSR